MRCVISALIFLFVCVPMIIISAPVVAVMLLTKWSGYTTPFGNSKWGRGHDHFEFATKTYWQEFNWLVLRNPVNNLHSQFLSVKNSLVKFEGNYPIGDKIAGGSYWIRMGWAWEYYYIKPYLKTRCVRLRAGWKIQGNETSNSSFVFSINPWKKYSGK